MTLLFLFSTHAHQKNKLMLSLFHVSDFSENTYFPKMLFFGKENIFKCLITFQKML